MFGSSMLDIALGIVFVFLLMSVLATAINEMALSVVNLRGRFLFKGVRTLFNEEGDAVLDLTEKIYNHGQVCGLYQGNFDAKKRGSMPAYIPSRNFALALLGVLEQLGEPAAKAAAAVTATGGDTSGSKAGTDDVAPTGDSSNVVIAPQAQVVQITNSTLASDIPPAIRLAAQQLQNQKVGRVLTALISIAEKDRSKFQKGVEDWFNSGMDRVSGWYKYHTQLCLFVIGIVLAIGINADATAIVRQLSTDPTLRQALVVAATNAKPPSTQQGVELKQQLEDAQSSFKNVTTLGIPLGWTQENWKWFGCWAMFKNVPRRLPGWLFTAIAVSLGAPFWFDILNKIMVIRSTVKPQEKSQQEASKDKTSPAVAT